MMNSSVGCDLLTVVVPVYRCGDCLSELCRRLFAVADLLDLQMEIVLVNDGCPEGSWQQIQELASDDDRIKGLNLFRNFGQHIAISAGLQYATGDCVVVMDGDLQDIPEELPKLYAKYEDGYDAVFARRLNRQDSLLKRTCSWAFNGALGLLSGAKHDSAVANYSLISRAVVDALNLLPERHRSYGLLVHWLRPRLALVDVAHGKREIGTSSYTFFRQIRLAADLVASHTSRPLLFSVAAGFLCSGLAVCYIAYLVAGKFIFGYSVEGWASTMASVWFLGGLILTQLGVIGLYLGKVFEQIKGRPLYVVRQALNHEEKSSAGLPGEVADEAFLS